MLTYMIATAEKRIIGVRVALLGLLFLAAAGAPAAAQTFRGMVVDDSTKRPLEAVTVTLLNARGVDLNRPPVRTDSTGRFTIHAPEIGRYQVRVTRIGYQPLTSQAMAFNFAGHVHTLNLAMAVNTTKLGTVTVSGTTRYTNSELLTYVGFELRKAKGQGKFLDTTELATYGRQLAAWVLEENKVRLGIEVVTGPQGFDVVRMLRGSATCTPEIWIDGFQANPNTAAGRLMGVAADQIYGIEAYNGLQLPPPSIAGEIGGTGTSLRPSQRCGALAIWTKQYANETKAKDAKKIPPR